MKKNSETGLTVFVASGCLIGALYFRSPVTFAMALVTGIISWAITKLPYEPREKTFLVRIFAVSVLSRLAICLLIYFESILRGGEGSVFDDDVLWPRAAWILFRSWTGGQAFAAWNAGNDPALNSGEYYLRCIAALYSVFGYYSPLIAKYFNIIQGSLVALMVYGIARTVSGRPVARLSAVLTAFHPSLVLWSVVSLKDMSCIFLLLLSVWLFYRYLNGGKRWSVAFPLIPLAALFTVRPFIAVIGASALATAYLVSLERPVKIAAAVLGGYIVLLLALMPGPGVKTAVERGMQDVNMSKLLRYHREYVRTGGNIYRILPAGSYRVNTVEFGFPEILIVEAKGVFYLLSVPFPWAAMNWFQLISSPQMLWWYLVLFFSIAGVCSISGDRFRLFSPIILVGASLILAMAIFEGNIGTAARHRDVITPYVILFASIGMVNFLYGHGKNITG
ncbi:MAG: glycosyltransferase family 39 protein [Candidatus Omnitrophica bacterium]|nr:glycosyltransferase family 39 protein [Candidatus Omnitrophota bacterium]